MEELPSQYATKMLDRFNRFKLRKAKLGILELRSDPSCETYPKKHYFSLRWAGVKIKTVSKK